MRDTRSTKRPAAEASPKGRKPAAHEPGIARASPFPGSQGGIRIATYARIGPLGADGPDEQMRTCRDAIPEPFGVAHFLDAGGAGPCDQNHGLLAMLRAAAAGLIDVVAVQSLDRLSRDPGTVRRTLAELERHGVRVVVADGGSGGVADVVGRGFMAEKDRARRLLLARRGRSADPARVRTPRVIKVPLDAHRVVPNGASASGGPRPRRSNPT